MLGWEYPPHISGGLGTACEGLTTALAPLDLDIQFVVPQLYGVERAPHMRLVSPALRPRGVPVTPSGEPIQRSPAASGGPLAVEPPTASPADVEPNVERRDGMFVQTVRFPALLSPYMTPEEYRTWARAMGDDLDEDGVSLHFESLPEDDHDGGALREEAGKGAHYGRNLFGEVLRFADRVAAWAVHQRPDIVHAHDWMTFPAATRVARALNVPLVVHIHSLEQDRSGHGPNPTIVAIESAGVRSATRVIAVSHYTARMIHEQHNVALDRISVVHNGVYANRTVSAYQAETRKQGPVVLFLGRITYQKGPEYFVEAAAKVLQKLPEARFMMAGSGDMLPQIQARVKELGIEAAFEFPGFVRGPEVERLFSVADAYVMPSVSEPFGIAALEAMSYETPVILSRQSGASEVLRHALKVDFWDVDRLAAQIVAVLKYPELRSSIVEMAREEVRRVHWEAAAAKVKQVYERAFADV
ncbi:MAG TPA: glycosyltransferase family 4 protein [Polyangiales bacterium]